MRLTVLGVGREEPPLRVEHRLQLPQLRIAREIASHREPEMIDLADGSRRRNLVHHAVIAGTRVPRIRARQRSPRELPPPPLDRAPQIA